TSLAFLDKPPAAALAEARSLLSDLGAIDGDGRITEAGEAMRSLALPVRLSHMVVEAGRLGQAKAAADLAVLLTERGLGGLSPDLDHRLSRFRADRSPRAQAARQMAERLGRQARPREGLPAALSTGALLALAYPDRIAKARGEYGRFVLANGRGGVVDAAEALAREAFLVVADLQGRAQNARIASAATISEDDIRALFADRLETSTETAFDPERRTVRVRETVRLGAIRLGEQQLPAP